MGIAEIEDISENLRGPCLLTMKHLIFANLVVTFVINRYLEVRQLARFFSFSPPKDITILYGQDKVTKALSYSRDKLWFTIVYASFSFAVELIVFQFKWYSLIWNSSYLSWFSSFGPVYRSIVFTFVVRAFWSLWSLPFNVYSIFCIERKHGFNNQTISMFVLDCVKISAVSILVGTPILYILLRLIYFFDRYFVIVAWMFTLLSQIVMMLIVPEYIQPLFNKFTRLPDGELRDKIELLAKRTSFPLSEIYVMDGSVRSSHSNAYFTGLFKYKRIVLYDTLAKQVSADEVVAILGHEIGHWKEGHVFRVMVFAQLNILILFLMLWWSLKNEEVFTTFGFLDEKPVIVGLLTVQYLLSPILFALNVCGNHLSRSHEYEADKYAVKLGLGQTLKSALVSIHRENLSNPDPDILYSLVHYSHPTLMQRLAAIDSMTKIQ